MTKVYLGFGSNIGDKQKNIETALRYLEENCAILKKSSFYETEPVGLENQDWFVNSVALIETNLSPRELLEFILNIEKKMGRERLVKWGPRNIDIDILFYNSKIIDEKDLKIPHPELQNREFVLGPLTEISPDFKHPVIGLSVKELLKKIEGQKRVLKK